MVMRCQTFNAPFRGGSNHQFTGGYDSIHGSHNEKFKDEDRRAAEQRDGEEGKPTPGGKNADEHSRRTRDGRLRGVHDGGEGHHRERDIRHVIEERTEKLVADGLADERERQDADKIRCGRHDEKI